MEDAAKRGKMMDDVPRFLSRDVIFHILTWLPADFLRNSARHVCKLWSDIILRDPTFTRTHLTRSPVNAVLLEATGPTSSGARFLEIAAEGEPIWKTLKPDPIGQVLSICDGVYLFYNPRWMSRRSDVPLENCCLCVANPITMEAMKLPNPPTSTDALVPFYNSIITRFPHDDRLVVICPTRPNALSYVWFVAKLGKQVSWEKVTWTPQLLDLDIYNPPFICCLLVPCGPLVYCCRQAVQRPGGPYRPCFDIAAIKLCGYTTSRIGGPPPGFCKSHVLGGFLRLGNELCCFAVSPRSSLLHVWALKGSQHQSEWIKLYKVKLQQKLQRRGMGLCRPIAWLDNNKILVFKTVSFASSHSLFSSDEIMYCNVKTGEVKVIPLMTSSGFSIAANPTGSLVSWR